MVKFYAFGFFFVLITFIYSNKSFSNASSRRFVLNQIGHPYCLFLISDLKLKIYSIPFILTILAYRWRSVSCNTDVCHWTFHKKILKIFSDRGMQRKLCWNYGYYQEKLKRSLILVYLPPIIVYACEIWTKTNVDELKLLIVKKKILRKVYINPY